MVQHQDDFGAAEGSPPEVGPEAELYANALDDCLTYHGANETQPERVLGLINTFHRHAKSKLQELCSHSGGRQSDVDMDLDDADDASQSSAAANEIRKWRQEAQTWDLLRRILPLRYSGDGMVGTRQNSAAHKADETNLWNIFIARGGPAVERKAVLEWLQTNARDGPDIDDLVRELQHNAERGEIIAHGWIHTRAALKLQKDLLGASKPLDPQVGNACQSLLTSSHAPLVSQLDPDAVVRQNRKLEPQDEYFERAIWVGCFQLLRRGCSLDKIRDWCAERTETWRAVAMSALPLPADSPQICSGDAASLALWRRMCFATARHGGTDEVERAVYGILAGDIESVEKVCKSWDDFMFMHYNALVRSEFDNFVLDNCSAEVSTNIRQTLASFEALQYHGDSVTAERRLVKTLSTNYHTSVEASEHIKVLQAAIIARDLGQHFYDQGLALTRHRQQTNADTPDARKYVGCRDFHGLRVVAHVLILVSALDPSSLTSSQISAPNPEANLRRVQEAVVEDYVRLLRLAGLEELIPLYCSKLLAPATYEVLSHNLRHLTDRGARLSQLSLIQKAGLDVLRFVRVQPQLALLALGNANDEAAAATAIFNIMQDEPVSLKYGRLIKTDFFGEDPDAIDPDDESLIRSLEWLLLVDEAWVDVIVIGIQAYKHFLVTMRLNAARQLALRIPFSQILQLRLDQDGQNEIDTAWIFDQDEDFWASQLETTTGDYQLSPTQLAAQARTFRDLESLVKALDTMETIASLAELSREDPSVKRDFWSKVANEVKSAKEYTEPILHGWLLTEDGDSSLEQIRNLYLPETILAYISTLHFAGTCLSKDNLLECMDLAAVIAEKDSDIAVCFIKSQRMPELVEAFASCSKALAIAATDKKPTGSLTKKMREMGWSRDLWSVK